MAISLHTNISINRVLSLLGTFVKVYGDHVMSVRMYVYVFVCLTSRFIIEASKSRAINFGGIVYALQGLLIS